MHRFPDKFGYYALQVSADMCCGLIARWQEMLTALIWRLVYFVDRCMVYIYIYISRNLRCPQLSPSGYQLELIQERKFRPHFLKVVIPLLLFQKKYLKV